MGAAASGHSEVEGSLSRRPVVTLVVRRKKKRKGRREAMNPPNKRTLPVQRSARQPVGGRGGGGEVEGEMGSGEGGGGFVE